MCAQVALALVASLPAVVADQANPAADTIESLLMASLEASSSVNDPHARTDAGQDFPPQAEAPWISSTPQAGAPWISSMDKQEEEDGQDQLEDMLRPGEDIQEQSSESNDHEHLEDAFHGAHVSTLAPRRQPGTPSWVRRRRRRDSRGEEDIQEQSSEGNHQEQLDDAFHAAHGNLLRRRRSAWVSRRRRQGSRGEAEIQEKRGEHNNREPSEPCARWEAERKANQAIADALKKEVRFGPGSIKISASGKKTLDNVAKILKQYPWMKIVVQAHSDASADGSGWRGRQCKELTEGRASSTEDYLRLQGVKNPTGTPRGKCGVKRAIIIASLNANKPKPNCSGAG